MQPEIKVFTYEGQQVEFSLTPNTVMVNATEMARIFNTDLAQFTRNEQTRKFNIECLKTANLQYLGIDKETDLITSKQKSGTWMHRVLALKFAAWLSPAFELWVYRTIDEILFGDYKKLKESLQASAQRQNKIEQLKQELQSNEKFQELERLIQEEKHETTTRNKYNKAQLELFRNI